MLKNLAISAVAMLLLPAVARCADPPKAKAADSKAAEAPKTVKPAERAVITPEREAAAITFVREHHSELVDLLNHLKETKPAEYQKAIRELFQTSERLAQLREQDPQRYDLELEAWKVKSRIQLLAARSTMSGDKSLEEQLHSALSEQADIRLRQMKLERGRVAERLHKLDKNIDDYQHGEAADVQRQFERMLKQISGSREQIKAAKTDAAAAGKTKSETNASR